MSKPVFPLLLTVALERPDRDDPYLTVLRGGVFDADEPGQPVAVYKRVSVGKVEISKRMVTAKTRKP